MSLGLFFSGYLGLPGFPVSSIIRYKSKLTTADKTKDAIKNPIPNQQATLKVVIIVTSKFL